MPLGKTVTSSFTVTAIDDGINCATLMLFKRSASTPSAPSAGQTYNFTTGELTGVSLGGWSLIFPLTGTDPVYVVQAYVSSDENTTVVDAWSTPSPYVANGENAESPYFADLDNEMDSIACDTAGKPSSVQTVSTNVSLWYGSDQISSPTISVYDGDTSGHQYTSGTAYNGVTVSWNNSTGKVQVSFAKTATINGKKVFCIKLSKTISGTTITKYLYFTVNGMKAAKDGDSAVLYYLVPSTSNIAKKGSGYYPSADLTCAVRKNVGGVDSPAASSEYNLRMAANGGQEIPYETIAASTFGYLNQVTYILRVPSDATGSDSIVDKETVLVIADGATGAQGPEGPEGPQGPQGDKGKMGRNSYYMDEWDDFSGSFVVTDYQTPYFSKGQDTDGSPICWIFVGANGTYTKSSAGEPSNSNPNWELMNSEFKYLITQVLFSKFAKLGAAIFNEDYMLSQYGSAIWKNGTRKAENARWYQYIDPDDVSALSIKTRNIRTTPVTVPTSTSFPLDSSSRTNIGSRNAGEGTALILDIEITGTATLHLKIADQDGSNAVVTWATSISERTVTATNHSYAISYLGTGSIKYLHYYKEGSGTVVINSIVLSDCKFRPNIYADWLKGFFYAQYGKFKNVVIEGVFNNLITEIDYDNNINRDLIIEYTVNNVTRYCLDVLRCGNMVRIKSLPAEIEDAHWLNIPYFISDARYERTKTLLDSDGTLLTTARNLVADDMRMLVGRKLVIILDDDFGWEQSYIPSFKATPSGIEGDSPNTSNLKGAIVGVANGQPHIKDSGDLSSLAPNDVKLNFKKTVYMECRLIRDVYNSRYCYIWTNTTADDVNGTGEPIDSSWT